MPAPTSRTPADVLALRADIPALQRTRNGKPPIYLNNTCMTLRPQVVIDALRRYYEEFPTCGGGRSEGAKKLDNWFQDELRGHEEYARTAAARLIGSDNSERASAARVIQFQNVLLFVIPASEVPAGSSAGYRASGAAS